MALMKTKSPDQMTLADHAEAWTREQDQPVPERDSAEWRAMYEKWIAWAFQDFREGVRA
jgi:hypothetical protein